MPEEEIYRDDEVKQDHDGIVKHFFYIDFRCSYGTGEPVLPAGAEKIEWVPREKLVEYDIIPPSAKLFQELGYL